MTTPPNQDMRDMLVRLDQQVKDGFSNLSGKMDSIGERTTRTELKTAEHDTILTEIKADRTIRIAAYADFKKETDDDIHKLKNALQPLVTLPDTVRKLGDDTRLLTSWQTDVKGQLAGASKASAVWSAGARGLFFVLGAIVTALGMQVYLAPAQPAAQHHSPPAQIQTIPAH